MGHAHARDEMGMAGERAVSALPANGVGPSLALPMPRPPGLGVSV